mgnify:CR=1 FL=1
MPHLIFDMDGTIIDSMPVHRSAWAQFAARYGLSEQAEELERATSGRTGVEGMRALFGAELPLELAQAYVHEKEALYREQFGAQFRWVGGFERFAMWARTLGLRCGLGTAGDRHNVRFCLERLPSPKLDGLFEVCVGGDEGLPGKPDYHARILSACEQAGWLPPAVHELRHWLSVVSLVSQGLGVALVPQALQQSAMAGVVFVPLPEVDVPYQTHCLWRTERDQTALRDFVQAVRQGLGPTG